MNTLIIGACFVVALLAIVGLVFSLREPATSQASTQKEAISGNAPVAASASIGSESTLTAQSSDLSMATSETHPSEQPTTLLAASTPSNAITEASGDSTHTGELADIDELDYAELPTIRSLPSNHFEGTRGEEERQRVTYDHLQTIANELRGLHTQMKNMEQRINVLTDQVQYLRGNEEPHTNWDVPNPTFKVPAK